MKTVNIWTTLFVTLAAMAYAGVPKTINYQGYLKKDALPASGSLNILFSLYSSNPTRSNPVWQDLTKPVAVNNGIYSTQIGSEKNSINAPFDVPYFLEVNVDGTDLPLQPLSSVPYALRAAVADSVPASAIADGSLSGSMLAGGTIISDKLADGAVTDAKITGPISASKLGSHTHGGADIIAGTVAITTGGTGATTASGALTNLGAVAKTGDNMTGALNLPANGLQLAGNQIVTSGGSFGYGAAPKAGTLFNIGGELTVPAPISYGAHLLQVDGTAKASNYGQAYLRGIYVAPTFDVTAGYANYLTGIETYMGLIAGSNVAHSVVGYHLNGQPASGLECSVGFGISVPNQQPGLCNGKYGFYQGDASAQYNYFASKVGIGTPFPAETLTVQGNAQISGNLNVGGQVVPLNGNLGFGAAAKPEGYFDISGTFTAPTYSANLLQVDGTAKVNGNYGQGYLMGINVAPTFDVSAGYANYLIGINNYMGYKVGGNVAHSVVGYHMNQQPSGGQECNVGFGLTVPNQQPSQCNGKYGFYQGGGDTQYNYFAASVGIGTPFPTQALTVQGNTQISGNITAAGTGAMPVYNSSGTAQNAPHMVTGTAFVNGNAMISLTGSAVFSNPGSFTCTASMQNSAAFVGVQYLSGNSFTLYGNIPGNVSYICVGN